MILLLSLQSLPSHSFRACEARRLLAPISLPTGTVGLYPGIFSFTKCLVRHLQYLLFLASQTCAHWTAWELVCAPHIHAVLDIPAPDPSFFLPWRTLFVDFIIGAWVNTFSHQIPVGILHQLGLLPHWLCVCLITASSEAIPFLHVWFVVFCRCLAGSSWRISVVFHSKTVSNDVRQSAGLIFAARFFWALGAIVFTCWRGVISVTHHSLSPSHNSSH